MEPEGRDAPPSNPQGEARRLLPSLFTSWSLVRVGTAALDIAIVSYVFYRFFLFIRGTRAVPLINGIIVLFVATALASRLRLETTYWLLQKIQVALAVALPVVFQPELRRALEQVGRGQFFAANLPLLGPEEVARLVGEVMGAVSVLSRNKIGALIVLERATGLGDIVDTGIRIDGLVSAELLVNLFIPNTPLHDGAVILRGHRILAAACFLPLAEQSPLRSEYGSRHRAAVGITEHSDAVAVAVSEETGAISIAHAGKLIRNLDEPTLREMLEGLLQPREGAARRLGKVSRSRD
jgi:diadenylate cyclase